MSSIYRSEASPDEFLEKAKFANSPDRAFAMRFAQRVGEHTSKGRVLCVGCGDGSMWVEVLSRMPERSPLELVLVDKCKDFVERAERNIANVANRNSSYPTHIVLLSEDMHDLKENHPEWEATFDLIVSNFVFHHSHDVNRLFRGMTSLLKEGGRLIFTSNVTANTIPDTCGLRPPITIALNGVFLQNPAHEKAAFVDALRRSSLDIIHEEETDGNYKIVGWDERSGRRSSGWEVNKFLFDERGELLIDYRAILIEALKRKIQ